MKTKQAAKHTPGPWTCQPIGDETECNILGSGRELIATVSDNDANLIAAGPTMLAALGAAKEIIITARQYFPKSVQNSDRFALELATATIMNAIHKAQGE